MPTLQDFHLLPSVATALEQLGWSADDPLTRECTPTAARGHNLIVVTPPSPAYATPALAGALSRTVNGTRTVVLCPPGQLEEWGAVVQRLTQGTGIRSQVARGTARAMRRLRSSEIDVLISGLTTANVLVSRSALDLQTVSCLLVAWPESWPDEDALAPLMQDLPKESQRIIYTSDPSRVVELAERYARKALTVGAAPAAVGPVGPVRTVSAPWSQRLRAVGDLVELLDPTSLAVWTIDRSYHDAIAQIVNSGQCEVAVVAREPAAAATIVAFDLPTNEKLRELVSAGEVVLLVPPGAEAYVASIAAPRRPIQLPAVIDTALEAEAAQRSAIVQTIESGQVNRSVATLAPLFERYDPVTVAGALLELWSKAGTSPTPASPEAAITAKVYVGAGKKDGVTPHDLVAVLTKDLRVQREKIGRIELRDTFSLIEIPSTEAEHVARGLNGSTIRKRRVTARVDRGPTNVNKRRV